MHKPRQLRIAGYPNVRLTLRAEYYEKNVYKLPYEIMNNKINSDNSEFEQITGGNCYGSIFI